MTTVVFDAILGPQGRGVMLPYGGFLLTAYPLDDFNDAIAWRFSVPSGGTVTDIGFFVYAKAGTPPTYKTGLVEMTVSGWASSNPYGGSSIEDVNNPPLGWNWITLSSPATVTMGDIAAIHVFPTVPIPNTSNRITITREAIYPDDQYQLPCTDNVISNWGIYFGGFGPFAIKYSDNRVYGFPIQNFQNTIITTETTPDEIGCKFTTVFDVNCVGATLSVYNASSSNTGLKISLYDSNDNELRSVTYLNSRVFFRDWWGSDGYRKEIKWNSPISLTKDAIYRLTVQNLTSISGIGLFGINFIDSNSRANNILTEFSNWEATVRTNSGAWTDYDNIIYDMGIVIDSFEITTSGGTTIISSGGGAYAYVS